MMASLGYSPNSNMIDKCRFSIPSGKVRVYFCNSVMINERACVPLAFVRDPGTSTSQSLRISVSKHKFLQALNLPFLEGRSNFVCVFLFDAHVKCHRNGPKRADMDKIFAFFQSNFKCLFPVVEPKILTLLTKIKSVVDDAGSGQLPSKKLIVCRKAITELEDVIRRYESASFVFVSVICNYWLWCSFLLQSRTLCFLGCLFLGKRHPYVCMSAHGQEVR